MYAGEGLLMPLVEKSIGSDVVALVRGILFMLGWVCGEGGEYNISWFSGSGLNGSVGILDEVS